MKRNDWILAAGVITAAVFIFCIQLYISGLSGGTGLVRVTVDGEEYGVYRLDQDQTVEIGDTNRLAIENGKVKMEWADCPDQVCVDHRAVSRKGESIICLPNHVVLSVESADEDGADGIDGVAG